ncbi:hypothetical protein I79_018730 [Cricetulus griseus]|uniref:Uncharacterized protein n=1 Tax=Cricetulus griseus TaxID=10029 RepID=G3I5I2_CRIGR|nr:hypothetical protein I79_018730 [Cricetulus griseus]
MSQPSLLDSGSLESGGLMSKITKEVLPKEGKLRGKNKSIQKKQCGQRSFGPERAGMLEFGK